ncbi:MAG: DUF3325 family protein [Pseudomonadota bacterium]
MIEISDGIWLVLAVLSAFLGCGCLALSQEKHWRRIISAAQSGAKAKICLKCAGWALVSFSLVFCVLRDGASFAVLLWPMLMAAAGMSAAMALALMPNR